MLYSPLEQFEVDRLIGFFLTNPSTGKTDVFILFSNINLFMLMVLFIAVFCYRYMGLYNSYIPKTPFQNFLELIVGFVEGLVKENVASNNKIFRVFTPYIFTIFIFILLSNFVGMVPYSFTITSSLIITFAIALASFIGINIVGARIHRFGFLALFLPPGCPIFISPFIILIETVSYIARVFSLSIRLFANMMAGHTLLKILAGFAWQMITTGGVWLIIGVLPIIIISVVSVLELAVAFLQTYVFTVLICLYIRDVTELH
jgi:ATP synthase subunit 6